ncbi:hypothetical protein, partial [Atlantibacter sp.]|uniref:hypothetical protein n=1 Tax=Atlantibacter sp. TaxID=1903473 RepID=UPI00289EE09B
RGSRGRQGGGGEPPWHVRVWPCRVGQPTFSERNHSTKPTGERCQSERNHSTNSDQQRESDSLPKRT